MSLTTVANFTQIILKILMTGIAFLILAIFCALLFVLISKIFKVKHDRVHTLRLANRSNFSSYFFLSLNSPGSNLQFNLSLNGVPLVPVIVPTVSEVHSPQKSVDHTQKTASVAPANTELKKPAIDTGGVMKKGQAAAAKVGGMATFLGTLGSLIPGPIGNSLRARSAALTQTQGNALAAMQAPTNAARDIDSLKQQSGQFAAVPPANAGQGSSKSTSVAQTTGTASASFRENIQDSVSTPSVNSPAIPINILETGAYIVQTKPLEPGEDYSLVLKISPQKQHYFEGTFGYTIKSFQRPVENLMGEPAPVVKQGVVNFPHISTWRYWLTPAFNILTLLFLLFMCLFIFRIIWL